MAVAVLLHRGGAFGTVLLVFGVTTKQDTPVPGSGGVLLGS